MRSFTGGVTNVDLSISVVTYNSRDYIGTCLRSVYRSDPMPTFEVTVVDNRSQDGTAALVRSEFPEVRVIENSENVGFARAHNQAIRLGKGRHYLILNPDTHLLPDTLDRMVGFLDTHPSVGAVAPLQYAEPEQSMTFSHAKWLTPSLILYGYTVLGLLFPNNAAFRSVWDYDWHLIKDGSPRQARGLGGFCLMASRACLEEVGLLDERFFLFHEDADWTLRMAQRGWKLYVLPAAKVIHYVGRSALSVGSEIMRIEWESACKYLQKHYGPLCAKFVTLAVGLNMSLINRTGIAAKVMSRMSRRSGQVEVRGAELELTWQEVPGAASYMVEVSTAPSFIYRAATRIHSRSWRLSQCLLDYWPQSVFYWRVRPVLDGATLGRTIAHGSWQRDSCK